MCPLSSSMKDEFGILSSDVDDRSDLGIKMLNSLCLGDDLIDEIATQELREKLPSDASKREGVELFGGNSLENPFQDPLTV